jgi:hypothetical protein
MRKRRTRRRRPERSSYLPLFITVSILLAWYFFRIAMFLSVPMRCVPIHEFWTTPHERTWPLFGAFALVFFLLFVWNAVAWLDRSARTLPDRTILVLNAAALIAIAVAHFRLADLAELGHYQENQGYATWNRSASLYGSNECEDAKPYLDRWEVVSVEVPFLGQPFPYAWIEFRRDLTVVASTKSAREPIRGSWSPPGRWRSAGWIWADTVEGLWEWELEGSRLTLTTHQGMGLPISRVVLARQ